MKDTSVGIVCITQENKGRPWILFEAGALAKGLSSNRVCTFLIDLNSTDLENPLAQFNHTLPNKDSVLSLVRTINTSQVVGVLDERILEKVFNTYWNQFEENFNEALIKYPVQSKIEKRTGENILTEILESTRFLNQRLRKIEAVQDKIANANSFGQDNKSLLREKVLRMIGNGIPIETIYNRLNGEVSMEILKLELDNLSKNFVRVDKV